jgi:hypothetical protein
MRGWLKLIRSDRENLEFSMSTNEQSFDSLAQWQQTRLAKLKLMFESATPLAVVAAMDHCDRNGLIPPSWAVTGSVQMQCTLLRGEPLGKHGRSNGIVERYRQDGFDFLRWDTVNVVRENRNSLRDAVKELRKLPGRAARERLAYCEKLLRWASKSSFKCASMLLADSPAFGGPDAVKTSFRTVERNMRDPVFAMRYHILDRGFLRRLGIASYPFATPGKKIVHLFDLTS